MADNGQESQADEARILRLRWIYGAVGLSALLSYASFHPIDMGMLAWVALVPLLFVCAQETRRVAWAMSFSSVVLFHVAGLAWIALVTASGWLMTAFLEGFYGMGLICIPLWLRRRTGIPIAFSIGAIGAAFECLRGNFPFIAFPWLFWGHSQHERDLLIQVADVTSVYGISFLVLMVNGAIADVALLFRERWAAEEDVSEDDQHRIGIIVAVPAALLLLTVGYGFFRLGTVKESMEKNPGPRLLVVQSDIPMRRPGQKPDKKLEYSAEEEAELHLSMTRDYLKEHPDEEFHAILWSETVWPYLMPARQKAEKRIQYERYARALKASEESLPPKKKERMQRMWHYQQELLKLPKETKTPLLVGAVDYKVAEIKGSDGRKRLKLLPEHNSYYCLAEVDGYTEVTGRYDKIDLVPVSEYIPFKGVSSMKWFFDIMKSFVPPNFSVFSRGEGPVLMEAKGHKLAPNICFEISFPELLRQSTKQGATAHVCPANDGWFVRGMRGQPAKSSAELPLARAHTKFRAIENRRPIYRCVNRGGSLVMDPAGEVRGVIGDDPDEVGVPGVGALQAPTTDLMPFYVRFGNVFPFLCALASFVLLFLGYKQKTLFEPTKGVGAESSEEQDSDS